MDQRRGIYFLLPFHIAQDWWVKTGEGRVRRARQVGEGEVEEGVAEEEGDREEEIEEEEEGGEIEEEEEMSLGIGKGAAEEMRDHKL